MASLGKFSPGHNHRGTRPDPDDHQGEEAVEFAEECQTGGESCAES